MTTIVKGRPPSTEIRAQLKAEGRPVLVAMSLGKDAIATNLALRAEGIETELAYLYYIPGRDGRRTLNFIMNTITELEEAFGQTIHLYPHPSLYRWLNNFVFQPPERLAVIEAARLPNITYEQEWAFIRQDLGLDPNTWIADGVRAADSIVRRASFTKHGVMKPAHHKVSPIYDWQKHEVMGAIEAAGIPLPIDYQWFGRSFDGIDHRFTEPLSRHNPEDYQQILNWFPLADLELFRKDPTPWQS
ncbi:hypothetical protein [Schaalia cardiffensis]|uniref:hypothetical protein n=1 Tax=Schaalia cardiffensis TaxID=181487 RepID=UPI0023F0919F|nr:hypothetical protein [Schaalia cardiffensis]